VSCYHAVGAAIITTTKQFRLLEIQLSFVDCSLAFFGGRSLVVRT
jgi:hypothetical protein